MSPFEVNVNNLLPQMTMEVRLIGMRRLTARLWLGMRFIKFGVWLTGMNCQVSGPEVDE